MAPDVFNTQKEPLLLHNIYMQFLLFMFLMRK